MSSFSKLPPIYQELKDRGMLSSEEYTRCWFGQLTDKPVKLCSRCFQSGHSEDDHCPFFQQPRDSYPGVLCAEGLPCPYRHSSTNSRPCPVCHYHECRTIERNKVTLQPCAVCHHHICCPIMKTESTTTTVVDICKQCDQHVCRCNNLFTEYPWDNTSTSTAALLTSFSSSTVISSSSTSVTTSSS